MKKLFVPVGLSLLFAVPAFAEAGCPNVSTTGPAVDVKAGSSAVYVVNVSGGDARVTPTYSWTVSAGVISSGQGTSVIRVDTEGTGGQSITATVDVGGYDRSCSTSSSYTVSVERPAQSRKYDEFTYLGPAKNEFARLDNLVIEMQNDPTAKTHIILYLGRKGLPGAIKAWTGQTVGYLAKKGIDRTRITTVDGGYRDNGMMELFIVAEGAELPFASPTVDPSEITPPAKKPATKAKTRKS